MAYGTVNTDIVSDSSGGRLAPISSVFRNRIINGAMVISQVGTSATISTTKAYIPDRWGCNANYTTSSTIAQSSNAPTGFVNSCLITVGTGASPAANDYFRVSQGIEGYNIADLGWGTANAKTITISFWVKSSLTGTFGVGLFNTNTRSYVSSYTISAANTWEQKTITIAGDTSGTWNTDNSAGVYLAFDLGEGTSRSTSTTNSWQASSVFGLTGGVKLGTTSGATWQLSGVQFEVGSSATGFEYRMYGTELNLCQRYYYQVVGGAGTGSSVSFMAVQYLANSTMWMSLPLIQTMRTAPTATLSNFAGSGGGSVTVVGTNVYSIDISNSGTGSGFYLGTGSTVTASAEL